MHEEARSDSPRTEEPEWESRDGVKRGRKNQEVRQMHKLWKVDCVSLVEEFLLRGEESPCGNLEGAF